MLSEKVQTIRNLLRPSVESLGFELLGVELRGSVRSPLLRVYIDHPAGITVDDCGQVSHQISGVLDVEAVLSDAYTLEVSSPGLDRPLFEPAHFERHIGDTVRLRLAVPDHQGRRRYSGRLEDFREGVAVLVTEQQGVVSVPFGNIESARLVPDFAAIGVGKGRAR